MLRIFDDSSLTIAAAHSLVADSFCSAAKDLEAHVDNTWGDTGKAIVNNWLGLVYRLTNLDRKLQYMPEVDAEDPLQIISSASQS